MRGTLPARARCGGDAVTKKSPLPKRTRLSGALWFWPERSSLALTRVNVRAPAQISRPFARKRRKSAARGAVREVPRLTGVLGETTIFRGMSRATSPPPTRPQVGGARGGVAGSSDRRAFTTDMEGMPRRFGKYTLLRKLAAGGMAELFLAIQKSVAGFEKLLVIKRILPAMNQDEGFIEMLLHEARIAATLSHPNIVQIFDVGQADEQYFIAMEHVHGEDLRSIVRQMREKGIGEFPLEHALAILLGVTAGLDYAHAHRDLDGTPLGIVHRDISPQNIVVTFSGDVKIVDFGIAKSGSTLEQTKSGKLKGKVPYMSPEQARGDDVDARTDIFAAGVLLFELTTGKRLFKGASEYETLKLICEREYPRPSEVRSGYPVDLEPIVMRALAKGPSARYQTAGAMQSDIEMLVRQQRFAVSNIALSRFMHSLFEDKLAAQNAALVQGKHLADIIEAERSSRDALADFEGVNPGRTRSGLIVGTGSEVRPTPLRRGRGAAPAVIAIALVALGLFFVARRIRPPVESESHPSLAPEATEIGSKGTLVVASVPSGASIWINGDLRPEVTPATLSQLPTGVPMDVKVTMDGFEQARHRVTLSTESPGKLRLELTKGSVRLEVRVKPEKAKIAIDGTPASGTQVEGLSSGVSHIVTVSAPGFVTQTLSVSGNPSETRQLDVTLEPLAKKDSRASSGGVVMPAARGKLNVGAAGGWCNVSVDGTARGATPVAGLELSAGNHRVVCITSEGKTLSATVAVPADGTARYKFSL